MILRRPYTLLFLLFGFAGISRASVSLEVQLTTTDATGNEVTDLSVGDDFFLNVYVEDVRGTSTPGVFSSYVDVTYSSMIAIPTGPVEHKNFPNGVSGELSILGLVDEAGGFSNSFLPPADASPQLIWSLPMTAIAIGRVDFASDPAEFMPIHETLFYNSLKAVDPSEVDFGTAAVNVVPEPGHAVLTMLVLGIIVAPILKKRAAIRCPR